MLGVKEFDSGVACLENYRETRARLRSLKPRSEPAPVPPMPHPVPPTAVIIAAEIPPVRPEVVMDRTMPMKAVVATVAEYYEIPLREILGPTRVAKVAFARQVAMYLLRASFDRSWKDIGRRVRRDHTCAIHGHRKIGRLLETDQKLRDDIDVLRTKLADLLPAGAA